MGALQELTFTLLNRDAAQSLHAEAFAMSPAVTTIAAELAAVASQAGGANVARAANTACTTK